MSQDRNGESVGARPDSVAQQVKGFPPDSLPAEMARDEKMPQVDFFRLGVIQSVGGYFTVALE